jgi:replication-associated recombination protein RarA
MPIKWLLWGPAGTGKSAISAMCAKAIAKNEFGIECIGGRAMSVNDVKRWNDTAPYRPMFGDTIVKRIEEFDLCNRDVQHDLLLFLDHQPKHWAVICTMNSSVSALEPRLQSRFKQSKFTKIDTADIAELLVTKHGVPRDVAFNIADSADGDVRQALNDMSDYLTI